MATAPKTLARTATVKEPRRPLVEHQRRPECKPRACAPLHQCVHSLRSNGSEAVFASLKRWASGRSVCTKSQSPRSTCGPAVGDLSSINQSIAPAVGGGALRPLAEGLGVAVAAGVWRTRRRRSPWSADAVPHWTWSRPRVDARCSGTDVRGRTNSRGRPRPEVAPCAARRSRGSTVLLCERLHLRRPHHTTPAPATKNLWQYAADRASVVSAGRGTGAELSIRLLKVCPSLKVRPLPTASQTETAESFTPAQ